MCELHPKSHSKFGISVDSALGFSRWQSLRYLGTGIGPLGLLQTRCIFPST